LFANHRINFLLNAAIPASMTEFSGFLTGVNKQRFLENLLEEKMLATERYATKWAAYIACLSYGILIPELLKDC
jgi:hypothetical protein